jgi:hypothetical protein
MTKKESIHIKCMISGEPAWILRELKKRGLVSSNKDAVNQGLCALYSRVIDMDLKTQQLKEYET